MSKGLQEIMKNSMESVKAGNQGGDTSVKEQTSLNETPTASSEKKAQGDGTVDDKETSSKGEGESKPTKAKVSSTQFRINAITSKFHKEREAKESLQSKLSEKDEVIAGLQAKLEKQSLSDIDDDESDEQVFTEKDIKKMVGDAIKDEKTAEQTKTLQKNFENMSIEFESILKEAYQDKYDASTQALDDKSMQEVQILVSKFNADPSYWLKAIKKYGVAKVVDTVMLRKPEKKEPVKEALKKVEKMDLETGSSTSTSSSTEKPKGLMDIMKNKITKFKPRR